MLISAAQAKFAMNIKLVEQSNVPMLYSEAPIGELMSIIVTC